ncbi:isopropylmalate/homocitrate/citramalate synthase [Prauserella shujinwangii]|uniref:Isopropylmalate/homocitrate/citramalate synthase n=1 Tax=Prauserella shujinwangii TaxID=1453103 RepID=A0A2T0LSN2_9PSEU|nr:UbiA family prenyltransferase [Prauserella shujinwangii]PRX46632.1 isopropylmalate/homocitrate/citramalate synthase [Prauserella shujinwangii]
MVTVRPRDRLLAHLEVWRPYTLGHAGLAALAAATLAAEQPSWPRLLGAWAVPTLGWLAGLYGGDYFDRALDSAAKPQRPIPSGRVAAGTARAAMIGCVVAGGAVAMVLNWRTVVLVAAALLLGVLYHTRFKARGLAGHVARGVLTGFAVLSGMLAVAPLPPPALAPLVLAFVLHDTGTNLIGALRDVDGDRAGGYETFPVRHGTRAALWLAAALGALWSGLAVVVPFTGAAGGSVPAFAALLAVAALAWAAVLARLWRAGEPVPRRAALAAHEVLTVERIGLGTAFLALGWGAAQAVAVGLPVAVLTVLAQRLLRARYEFADEPGPSVSAETILGYVDARLRDIAGGAARPVRTPAGWRRRIRIRVADLPLDVHLVADGAIRRVPSAEFAAGTLPSLTITTTSDVFADIFLSRRSTPRRAYLSRAIRMDASARDMLSLNQIFNEFRRAVPAPAPDRAPARTEQPGTGSRAEAGPGLLPDRVVISDTTLRDGEQMPGVAFAPEAKVTLARELDALGVPLIEAGFPAVSRAEEEAVRAVAGAGLDAVIQVIARPRRDDIDAAVRSGAHSIAVFVGTSDAHIRAKLRTTPDALLRDAADAVAYAKRAGHQVVFAAEDATRTDPGFLITLYDAVAGAGADAVGLADTAGVATPWSLAALVRRVTEACELPLAVHCHNDLGLATANSVAGVLSGASGVQCSVLGIGERAGNAALEEVVLTLEIAFGHRTGLDLPRLTGLARRVGDLAGTGVPVNKAVVGENAFVHESGLHVDGLLRDAATYEPYEPALLGRQRRIVFGKHSGRSGIAETLRRHDIALDEGQLGELVREVKRGGTGTSCLDENGLVRLAGDLLKGASCRTT